MLQVLGFSDVIKSYVGRCPTPLRLVLPWLLRVVRQERKEMRFLMIFPSHTVAPGIF